MGQYIYLNSFNDYGQRKQGSAPANLQVKTMVKLNCSIVLFCTVALCYVTTSSMSR